nr:30S ribosomal protein S20 [Kineococcus siccus]
MRRTLEDSTCRRGFGEITPVLPGARRRSRPARRASAGNLAAAFAVRARRSRSPPSPGAPRRSPRWARPPSDIDRLDDKEAHDVANIKSQIKRIKTNEKARLRNKAVKSELRTAIRHFKEAAASGDAEKTTAALRLASKKLDKAVSKGVIHKNQAANRKSSIAKAAAKV